MARVNKLLVPLREIRFPSWRHLQNSGACPVIDQPNRNPGCDGSSRHKSEIVTGYVRPVTYAAVGSNTLASLQVGGAPQGSG